MYKKILKWLGKMVFLLLPGVLGFLGYRQIGGKSILDNLFETIHLYSFSCGVSGADMNLALEIARWTAPAVTATVLLTVLFSLMENIKMWFVTRFTEGIAIHGDSDKISCFLKNLGWKGFRSDKKMSFRAKKDDFAMYRFLKEHKKELLGEKKEVYLCSENILRGNYEDKHLTICNIAENCAREYWRKYPVAHKKEKILLIGFENYGQRLLTQAILKNVISMDSEIEYHVAGGYQSYLSKHSKLNKAVHVKIVDQEGKEKEYLAHETICDNQDTLYFYDMPWYEVMSRGIDFDRIILINDADEENLSVLNELKRYYVCQNCHIKFTDRRILEALWGDNKKEIIVFGTDEELYEPDVILKEKLFEHAKMIHARYYAKWQCDGICSGRPCGNKNKTGILSLRKCAACPKMIDDWNKQTTFIRYSNVAQADHIPEKLRLLVGSDCEDGAQVYAVYERLSCEEKTDLWHLEHIRWNRYHFMNNWDFAEKRDNANRRHHLLKPFEELPLKEQEKDGDAYETLADIL